ncbi:uncharacterized protein TRUGW13939_05471 [Talaromyces rugulosus]|uniref:Uncharacterized protein n=1 Tax=Talaromyces rugulosus TaxID=121627 RepID=A0A7H8QWF0_TALRU|nr:uncharacterized protein TRUGW13939_05471 [Talaromyces rugulosus]QKX58349.1 hypothetical protein TRUGW13939_05471 [Talaromyces rugulosus]
MIDAAFRNSVCHVCTRDHRRAKIATAKGAHDESPVRRIGLLGVGFYSILPATDKMSDGAWIYGLYDGRDPLSSAPPTALCRTGRAIRIYAAPCIQSRICSKGDGRFIGESFLASSRPDRGEYAKHVNGDRAIDKAATMLEGTFAASPACSIIPSSTDFALLILP